MNKSFYYKDDWIDAQQKHLEFPDTFNVPTEEELSQIEVGWTVKICNGIERFWTEVVEIAEEYLLVRVDNRLVNNRGYNLGDILWIEKKNIYEIHTKTDILQLQEMIKLVLDEKMKNMEKVEDIFIWK